MRYKIDFLGQIDLFPPNFFRKSGQGGLIMDDLRSLSLNITSLVGNKNFLFRGTEAIS